jgi:hypothetical protein
MCLACWESLPDRSRKAVLAAEGCLDGIVSDQDRINAVKEALDEYLAIANRHAMSTRNGRRSLHERGASAAYTACTWEQPPVDRVLSAALSLADACRNREVLVAIIRDIYGNPFRPVACDPTWRNDTVVSLAKHTYESRDFSAMPILADALQDAGCENEDILNHCRDPKQVHVRGCWVVDVVLGK